jgi:thioredoxin reductase (NADPH)
MQQRALTNPKVEMVWHHTLDAALGKEFLEGVRIQDVNTGKFRDLEAKGLFYAIGHTPNTEFLAGQIKTDESGYILTVPGSTLTSVPGVFAAGDVQDKRYRQAITSAGTGCMAALDAEHFLADPSHGH